MSRWGPRNDLHFTPGDDSKPPLLTVPIGTPISRKETRTMPHLIDAATKQRALDLLELGRPVMAVADTVGVSIPTVRRWKQEADQKPPDDDDVPAPIPPTIVAEGTAVLHPVTDAPMEDVESEPFTPVPMMFTVEYDATAMDAVLRRAILAWVQQATETHWGDGQNPSIRLPDSRDVPTRWIVQVTPTAMVPAEDA